MFFTDNFGQIPGSTERNYTRFEDMNDTALSFSFLVVYFWLSTHLSKQICYSPCIRHQLKRTVSRRCFVHIFPSAQNQPISYNRIMVHG